MIKSNFPRTAMPRVLIIKLLFLSFFFVIVGCEKDQKVSDSTSDIRDEIIGNYPTDAYTFALDENGNKTSNGVTPFFIKKGNEPNTILIDIHRHTFKGVDISVTDNGFVFKIEESTYNQASGYQGYAYFEDNDLIHHGIFERTEGEKTINRVQFAVVNSLLGEFDGVVIYTGKRN